MKLSYHYIILLWLFVLFSSCEKKIELHPENSEEKIFVESIFSDLTPLSYVRLSKTKGIYESITGHPIVKDATVQIEDLTDGTVIDFTYVAGEGQYQTTVAGIPGHQYRLKIEAEGQQITARQTMTSIVNFNGVSSVPVANTTDKYYMKMKFDDPPETEDYYLFIMMPQNQNDPDLEPRFTVRSDLLYNRAEGSLSIEDEIFNKDEDWLVLFYHVDTENYNYLHTILRAMKSLVNGAHPFYGIALGNPQDNVEGEKAFGFFIASPVRWTPIHIGN